MKPTTMVFDGTEYNVYTDEERQEAIREIVEEDFELFNEDFIISVLDEDALTSFFTNIYDEWNRSYANDIETERYTGEYDNRLEEEMAEAGVDNIDEFVDWMTERQIDEGLGGLQHYIWNFGKEEAYRLLKENTHLVDFDVMAEMAVNADGYGHYLNHYDGTEIEFEFDGETYYAYRV